MAQTSSVISLVRRRNIYLSTIGIGQKSEKFSEISKLDISGVHFILSRSVRLLYSIETQDEILSAICGLPEKPQRVFHEPITVEESTCDVEMKSDILFLLDGSYSTKKSGFKIIQDFVSKVVQSALGDIQYAALQYSDRTIEEFPFRLGSSIRCISLE